MKLLQQIINKKLELQDELLINRRYKRAIWDFYMVLNISIAVLNIPDKIEHQRNRLWKRFLLREIDEKSFKKIKLFMNQDMGIIIKALKYLEVTSAKQEVEAGEGYYKPNKGHIGIMSYEMVE